MCSRFLTRSVKSLIFQKIVSHFHLDIVALFSISCLKRMCSSLDRQESRINFNSSKLASPFSISIYPLTARHPAWNLLVDIHASE